MKKYVPIILVALTAHHTPNSKSRNGTSIIILGCSDNDCLFYVLLTTHLSIILAIDQLNAQILVL
jgi:hypothetical protein